MAKSLRDINCTLINSLGLDDGFRLPVANEANKRLEEKYLEFQKRKTTLEVELNEESDRAKDIENHLKNVKNEISFIQMLLLAKAKEIEDESSMAKVREGECTKVEKEILQLNKQLQVLKERENDCENSMFKLNQRIEERKRQMDWDQQTLESWLEECRRRDDNLSFLEKYSRQDESKIKELSMKIASLTEETTTCKKKLDQEVVETQAAQYGLDKTAGEYRKSHAERRELVQRWQQTLERLQRKDTELEELALKITERRREVKMKEVDVKDAEEFLTSEQRSNEEVKARIRSAENMQAKRRQFVLELEAARLDVIGQLQAIKLELERLANDLESRRGEVKAIKQEILSKNSKRTSIAKQLDELRQREKSQSEDVASAETRTKRVEEMVEEEEKMQKRLEEEMKSLNVQLYKRQQAVHELTNRKKSLEGDLQSAQAAIKTLTHGMEKQQQEIAIQTKLLYNQDYRILELNKKLSKVQGEVTTEEENVHLGMIGELERELEGHKKTLQFTMSQHQHLEEDVKRLKQQCDRLKESRNDHSRKAQELELKIEVTRKALKDVIGQKQDKLMHENLKKLELKRLRNLLFRRAKENTSVEKDLTLMRAAMDERRQEVADHRAILVAELRLVEDRARKTTMELQEKMAKIEQLKNRYDIVSMKMTPHEGEESVAGYLIRAAQQLEELKMRGNQLNRSIASKEKELMAFDNTVALVAGRNELQRSSLCRGLGSANDEDSRELGELDDKLKMKQSELRAKKRDLDCLARENEKLIPTLQSYQEEIAHTQDDLFAKKQKLMKLKKETNDQNEKLERVKKMNRKLSRELMARKKSDLTDEELDISVRELKELNDMASKEINSIISEHPSLYIPLQRYFEQANIPMSPQEGVVSRNWSPSLLSLRSSQGLQGKLTSSRLSSPKLHTISVAVKDVTPQFDSRPNSRPGSMSSSRSSKASVRSQSSKK